MARIPNKDAIPDLDAAFTYIEQFLWETGDFKLSARATDHGRWVRCDGRSAAQWPELDRILLDAGAPVSGGHALLPGPEARALVAAGTGGGLQTRSLWDKFGTEPSNAPSHSHTMNFNTGGQSANHSHSQLGYGTPSYVGGGTVPGVIYGSGDVDMSAHMGQATTDHTHNVNGSTAAAGSGSATDGNVPPSIAINLFVHT